MAMAIPFLAAFGTTAAGTTAAGTAVTGAAAASATSASLAATTAAGLSAVAAPTLGGVAASGITAAQVMGAVTAASGIGSAVMTQQAGVAADQAARVAAKQEKDAARGREIERRRGLLTALASQSAAAGAQGVAFSGGKAAAAKRDIKDARNDLLTDAVNTRRNIRMLRLQGKSARTAGDMGAATSLLNTGVKTYQNFG